MSHDLPERELDSAQQLLVKKQILSPPRHRKPGAAFCRTPDTEGPGIPRLREPLLFPYPHIINSVHKECKSVFKIFESFFDLLKAVFLIPA